MKTLAFILFIECLLCGIIWLADKVKKLSSFPHETYLIVVGTDKLKGPYHLVISTMKEVQCYKNAGKETWHAQVQIRMSRKKKCVNWELKDQPELLNSKAKGGKSGTGREDGEHKGLKQELQHSIRPTWTVELGRWEWGCKYWKAKEKCGKESIGSGKFKADHGGVIKPRKGACSYL